MSTPANLDFETDGAGGGAQAWSIHAKSSRRMHCGFRALDSAADPNNPIADPNDFAAGSWTATEINVVANATTAPDGTATADRLADTGVTNSHKLQTDRNFVAGGTYTFSVFVKAGTHALVALGCKAGTLVVAAFELFQGRCETPPLTDPGLLDAASAGSVDVGDGWFLLWLSVRAEVDTAATWEILMINSETDPVGVVYAGTNATIFAWGAAAYAGSLTIAEGFDWSDAYTSGFAGTAATFTDQTATPKVFEAFEAGWDNYPYGEEFQGGAAATFDTGTPETVEDFEEEWSTNESWTDTFTGTAATFDGDAAEDFEDGWFTNESWTDTFTGTDADFDSTDADPSEDFEEVIDDFEATVTPTPTNTINKTAHPLVNGNSVYLLTTGGFSPGGINETTRYFVVNAAADSFKLSLTSGGAAVTITDAGTGTHTVQGDPARFWVESDRNHTLD